MNVGKIEDTTDTTIFVSVNETDLLVQLHSRYDVELTPGQAEDLVVLLLDAIQLARGTDPSIVGQRLLKKDQPDPRVRPSDPDKPRRPPMCGLPT